MKNLESIFNVSLQYLHVSRLTSLTFFYSVSEPVLNYPLFGIEGKVFSVVLIHILFVEVAFTVYIIQNPDARKQLKNTITGSTQTVQIIRIIVCNTFGK